MDEFSLLFLNFQSSQTGCKKDIERQGVEREQDQYVNVMKTLEEDEEQEVQ